MDVGDPVKIAAAARALDRAGILDEDEDIEEEILAWTQQNKQTAASRRKAKGAEVDESPELMCLEELKAARDAVCTSLYCGRLVC